MTPMRLDTILAGLDLEEREVLLDKILAELTLGEIVDALTHLWDRRADDTRKTVGQRCAEAYAEYREERDRIDAEIRAEGLMLVADEDDA